MRAFDERQHVTLTTPLAVDISQPGTYKLVADETPATIPAGTVVDSHFVHVDKDTQFSTILTGTIHLDSDVLGIVLRQRGLAARSTPATTSGPPARSIRAPGSFSGGASS